ncbi:TCHP [Acanthosepion pharaonis]|uniref:Trichoplein keratin filament-binding protein n=1 Tax=Acanthosepion pharaonis TaxID=158019 RepID=A0A812DE40_ACAPH|nr:TCHP [Sepia pharaonis]
MKLQTTAKKFIFRFDSKKEETEKERKSLKLKQRRAQLAAMLHDENLRYETELKELSPRTTRDLLEDMRERVEGLQSAREEKRRQLADEKLLEHWYQNNPEIREVESKLRNDHVVSSWKEQIEDQQQRLDTARTEAEEYNRMMEERRKASEEAEKAAETKRLQQQKDLQSILQRQMQELQQKEREAAMLKEKQDKIMMERQQLEEDHKLLELLAVKDAELDEMQAVKKEKAIADAQWMKEVIEEQLKLEKAREAELELLEEAARVWDKREREWEKEKRAREKLMAEVLATRKEQMDRKLQELRKEQEESVQLREELLKDMELANQLSQREQKKIQQARMARKQELEEQLSARQQEALIAQEEEERAQETARLDAEEYEDILRKQTERLQIQGYKPRDFRRKNAWL